MHTSDCVVKERIASEKRSLELYVLNSSDPVEALVDYSIQPPVADYPNVVLLFITHCDANVFSATVSAPLCLIRQRNVRL